MSSEIHKEHSAVVEQQSDVAKRNKGTSKNLYLNGILWL